MLLLGFSGGAFAETIEFSRSYWVWHRTAPLRTDEAAELHRQRVRTLYWHCGELETRGNGWIWKNSPQTLEAAAPGFRVVPVVRLANDAKDPFSPAHLSSLAENLRSLPANQGEVQIDFDCPDRLIGSYASALHHLRKAIPHLSITALEHWRRLPDFSTLTDCVDEIVPMFYDMQGDPTGIGPEVPPPPILAPGRVGAALREWSRCPIPWRAGLPTFARLTVFDRTGLSRGQIPNWSWDNVCFHRELLAAAPTRLGVTLFRAASDTRVASTAVQSGEFVASRHADRTALAQVFRDAAASGAAGLVLFRLPDGEAPAGASLSDLGMLGSAAAPRLVLRQMANERLELVNDSPFDLPPRLSGGKSDRDRGYALEFDAPAPVFREALPGDFWRVASHAHPDAKAPIPVVVPLATRLTFWFSQLRAGATLNTGLLQLAPGAKLDGIRFRILNCEGSAEWKSLTVP